jgi:hypothetical protein
VRYATAVAGTAPETIGRTQNGDIDEEVWKEERPAANAVLVGHNIYTMIRDKFNNNTLSDPRYTIDGGRAARVELSRTSASIPATNSGVPFEGLLGPNSTTHVYVYDGTEEVTNQTWFDSDGNQKGFTFEWESTNGYIVNAAPDSEQIPSTKLVGDIKQVKLYNITSGNLTATITVTVYAGTMKIGTATCTISLSKQGDRGV